jgi:hypothetical protein
MDLTILMPVYDDWPAAAMVCAGIDEAVRGRKGATRILLVDDGSTVPHVGTSFGPLKSIQSIDLLRLRRNLGHQRAIAVGLVHIHRHRPGDSVVVMDSDGEDRPEDVPRLLASFEQYGCRFPVFAERRRRVTGLAFKAGYLLFRFVHRILTGRGVRVGNFSILPPSSVSNLVVQSSLWSHYAATVVNARVRVATIPLDRGARLSGASRMNFVALVAHGLGAVSVFRETVATRLLLATLAVFAAGWLMLAALLSAVAVSTVSQPWVWLLVGLIGVSALQIVVAALAFTLATLATREQSNVLPVRDCELFVLDCQVLVGTASD